MPIDRVAAGQSFYSGKHRRHGVNLQVISSPSGDILWASGPLPGTVHDLTAARIWGIIRELAASGLVVLADKGSAAGSSGLVRAPQKVRPFGLAPHWTKASRGHVGVIYRAEVPGGSCVRPGCRRSSSCSRGRPGGHGSVELVMGTHPGRAAPPCWFPRAPRPISVGRWGRRRLGWPHTLWPWRPTPAGPCWAGTRWRGHRAAG